MADEENSEIAQRIGERLVTQLAHPGADSWARWKVGSALGYTTAVILEFRGGSVACVHSWKGETRGYEYQFGVIPAGENTWSSFSSPQPESIPGRIWTLARESLERARSAAVESFVSELVAFEPSAEERALEDVVLQVGMSMLRRLHTASASAIEWHALRGTSGYLTELADGHVVIEHDKSGYRLQLTDVDRGRRLAEAVSEDPQSVPGRVFTAAQHGHMERATSIAKSLKAELDGVAIP